jgi:2-polyprenyl-3-methyl-5-hydroxy-6-metoxy-1,4-benzoquinol methylase
METKKAWDEHAERWESCIKTIDFLGKQELAKNKNYFFSFFHSLKEKKKILDAGCGFGYFSVYAAKLGHEVVGIDFSEKNLSLARRFAAINKVKIKFIKSDVRCMPFKDKQFDVVISAGVIEHVPETGEAVKEHSRVLKNGGTFIGNVPHRYTSFVLSKLFLRCIGKWDVGYEKSFSIRKFRKYLSAGGFKAIETKRLEIEPGIKFPKYGKMLRILDKPLWLLGLGGAHFAFLAE